MVFKKPNKSSKLYKNYLVLVADFALHFYHVLQFKKYKATHINYIINKEDLKKLLNRNVILKTKKTKHSPRKTEAIISLKPPVTTDNRDYLTGQNYVPCGQNFLTSKRKFEIFPSGKKTRNYKR